MPVKTTTLDDLGSVTIVRKRGIRTMRLNVDNQGIIRLTLPWWVSMHIGLDFVLSKSDWIKSQKQAVAFTPSDGMKFGKNLLLRVEFVSTPKLAKRLDENVLTIRVPERQKLSDGAVNLFVSKSMSAALRTEAEAMLIPRIRQLEQEHGFVIKSCTVKQLKARWGSCNQHHDIVLNLYLIQLPWDIIDYVLLHELNHTKHLYHGPVFWDALQNVCPNAKELRKKLKAYQPRLYDGRKP